VLRSKESGDRGTTLKARWYRKGSRTKVTKRRFKTAPPGVQISEGKRAIEIGCHIVHTGMSSFRHEARQQTLPGPQQDKLYKQKARRKNGERTDGDVEHETEQRKARNREQVVACSRVHSAQATRSADLLGRLREQQTTGEY
jgi:hypothetical protein